MSDGMSDGMSDAHEAERNWVQMRKDRTAEFYTILRSHARRALHDIADIALDVEENDEVYPYLDAALGALRNLQEKLKLVAEAKTKEK
jgi:hypothetical protein